MSSQSATEDAGRLRGVLVGAGHRGQLYASYADDHPDELMIVAVVDPDERRRTAVGDHHRIAPELRFRTVEELIAAGPVGQVVINATMDRLHLPTTLPLLRAGYDVLLEKPIGVSMDEVLELQETAQTYGRTVMICHVLRYAPFYQEIKRRVLAGELGRLMNLQLSEHVSYHHQVTGFVRGKWSAQEQGGSAMLLAKSCHDLDLLTWLMSGIEPVRVSSAGSLMHFRRDQAPVGAGTRCLTDCQIEEKCAYSARRLYVDQGLWKFYAWEGIEQLGPDPTREQKLESLRTDNPYGRCVWHSDNTVVDHQSVLVEFADGATGTMNMIGNSAKPCRTIRLLGTEGELEGVLEDGRLVLRRFDPEAEHGYAEEIVDFSVTGEMHGGGDLRLVADFVATVRGKQPSVSATTLADSINGHVIGFSAERARLEQRLVELTGV